MSRDYPYKPGDEARIKEDINAADGWKGEEIVIEEIHPNEFDEVVFRMKSEKYGNKTHSWANLYEIEPIHSSCGHRAFYHKSKEGYFCPWCEE